jgi:hypothetical protein
MSVKRSLRRLFTEQNHVVSHRVPSEKKRVDTAMLALALLSVFVFVLELNYRDPLGLLFGFSILVDLVFLADYLLRAYYSGLDSAGRWSLRRSADNYLLRWYGIVDAIATLPPILTHLFHLLALSAEFSRISRVLRLARFTRFLRLLRAVRLFRETRNVTRLMREHHSNISRELNFTVGIVVVVIIIGGLGLHYLSGPEDAHYRNPIDAIYWSILGVMGQSDGFQLMSWSTRVLGIVIIFAGIAFFGIVSGSITTFIMDAMNKRSNGTEAYHGSDHIIVCGFNSKLEELLGYLHRLPEGRDIVLLFDSDSDSATQEFIGTRMNEETGKTVQTQWVRGNPRTADGLERASVAEAREIIVLADEAHGGLSEEDLDARTLMTLEMLSHYYDAHLRRNGNGKIAASVTRNDSSSKRLRVTVELKTPQSVQLAKKKGANVVYADDLICQYITLDAHAHDASPIYSRLIDTHDQSIELLDIDASAMREAGAESAFEAMASQLAASGRIWLGLNVPMIYVIEALAFKDDMDVVLKESGLLGNTEHLWDEIREEHIMNGLRDVAEGTDPRRYDLVDIPALTPADGLFVMLRDLHREGGIPPLLVLNPWARKTFCLQVLERIVRENGITRLQAICMRSSAIRSPEYECQVLSLKVLSQ